ncbi:hypothetical protein HMPREF0653_02631 [Prevotella disiens JCM 6334 = ATCC 29426]|uniref:Uncharacterized protein n=1 Tax=Prevotella disiens JCM 6334 = ATCC 29426 TaxID=1235811 RepID=A0ABP2Y7X9_9BACT|nr:hypothetical protein HMPREF0653_02631 [Prevotella disiens JCM 6334 = ATCC 29426]
MLTFFIVCTKIWDKLQDNRSDFQNLLFCIPKPIVLKRKTAYI